MFLVHLDKDQSGLGLNCATMKVDAAAFQITGTRHGDRFDTFTATFFNEEGRPVNAYGGIVAIEEIRERIITP